MWENTRMVLLIFFSLTSLSVSTPDFSPCTIALMQPQNNNVSVYLSWASFVFKLFSFNIYIQKYYIFYISVWVFFFYTANCCIICVRVSINSQMVILLVTKVLSSFSFFGIGALTSPHVENHKYSHPSLLFVSIIVVLLSLIYYVHVGLPSQISVSSY